MEDETGLVDVIFSACAWVAGFVGLRIWARWREISGEGDALLITGIAQKADKTIAVIVNS